MEVLRRRGYKEFLRIDSGGQARVYKSVREDEQVAIKVIQVTTPLKKDIKRELQIMRNMSHPNCMRVKEMFRTQNKFYIIMEYMPNGTISSLVKKFGPVCEWNARSWFNGIVHAVRYLHQRNIAHRDLKLENVLLDEHLNPVVSDFGFSLFVETDENGEVVKSHTFCGTPSYHPPEIIKRVPYNPFKGDIWCLGVVLFIMINKIYPFDRHNREKMLENQLKRNYHLQKHIEERCSNEVKDLIKKLLEPFPKRRPSIQEVCKHPWIPIVMHQDEYVKKQIWAKTYTTQMVPRISISQSMNFSKGGKTKKSINKIIKTNLNKK